MNAVYAPSVPLYLRGYAPPSPVERFVQRVVAPKTPLHQLGWLGDSARLVAVGAGVASKVATPAIVSTTGVAAGSAAAGALTAGIGAGIVILGSLIAGLWSAHEARAKGAKAENQAINSAVQTFDAGIHAIFDAANSSDPAKNITGAQAAQACEQLLQTFFAQMAPLTHGPGAADSSGGGANCGNGTLNPGGPCTGTPGGHKCDSSCTATCCVGCQDLYPTMLQAVQVFSSPNGGSIQVCTVYGSKYGAQQRAGYTLTYTPPKIASPLSQVGGGIASGIESALGIPSAGGSSSALWVAAAVAAFFLLR